MPLIKACITEPTISKNMKNLWTKPESELCDMSVLYISIYVVSTIPHTPFPTTKNDTLPLCILDKMTNPLCHPHLLIFPKLTLPRHVIKEALQVWFNCHRTHLLLPHMIFLLHMKPHKLIHHNIVNHKLYGYFRRYKVLCAYLLLFK